MNDTGVDARPGSGNGAANANGLIEWYRENQPLDGSIYRDTNGHAGIQDVVYESGRYEPGPGSLTPLLWFSVCRSGGGRIKRVTDAQNVRGDFIPGVIDIAIPARGFYDFTKGRITAVGVSMARLDSISQSLGIKAPLSLLEGNRLFRDPLIEQAIIAVSRHVQRSALSTIFFDHAVGTILLQLAAAKDETESLSGLSAKQVGMIVEYVRGRLDSEIAISELAQVVGLSVSEFSRRFKSSTGHPPYAFVTQLRMKEAVTLLRNSDISVSEISAQVGYGNPSQFAQAFQRFSGRTPTKWRKEALG